MIFYIFLKIFKATTKVFKKNGKIETFYFIFDDILLKKNLHI